MSHGVKAGDMGSTCIGIHSDRSLRIHNFFRHLHYFNPQLHRQLHETTAEGAKRETWEEAGARVDLLAPFAHFDIPTIGQVRKDCCVSHEAW